MNPMLDLDISDDEFERMEAEANKPQTPRPVIEPRLGDEELELPDFPC